jgi:hypothetical protein
VPKKPKRVEAPEERAARWKRKEIEARDNLVALKRAYAEAQRIIAAERLQRRMFRITQHAEWLKAGKPADISDETLYSIFALHGDGEALAEAVEAHGITFGMFWWVLHGERAGTEEGKKRLAALARAREAYAHSCVSRLETVVEAEPDPAKAKVLSDVLRFMAAKALPAIYGERAEAANPGRITLQFNLAPTAVEKVVGSGDASPSSDKQIGHAAADSVSAALAKSRMGGRLPPAESELAGPIDPDRTEQPASTTPTPPPGLDPGGDPRGP